MKNLLVFVNPLKRFANEDLARIQIDNSLRLGWEKEDIVIATNFEYEYRGIKSLVVPDSCFCEHRRRASKLTTICYLFDEGLIKDDCWFHDFDAYQLRPFGEGEPNLDGKEAGFVFLENSDYPNFWNSGSFFFKPDFRDIFQEMKRVSYKYECHDEQALIILVERNANNVNDRYKKLNCTYNLCRLRSTKDTYDLADKPVRILHFDVREKKIYEEVKPLIPGELVGIFSNYGYV